MKHVFAVSLFILGLASGAHDDVWIESRGRWRLAGPKAGASYSYWSMLVSPGDGNLLSDLGCSTRRARRAGSS